MIGNSQFSDASLVAPLLPIQFVNFIRAKSLEVDLKEAESLMRRANIQTIFNILIMFFSSVFAGTLCATLVILATRAKTVA